MRASVQFTPRATEDLDAIWWFIAQDNRDAANRVEAEIVATCLRLAEKPRMGTRRQDLTLTQVRFWTVTKFPNYVIVYFPETIPMQVVAVLHGKRDLKEVLEGGTNQRPRRSTLRCVNVLGSAKEVESTSAFFDVRL
jgi:plasmid stabilization system protein ParE